MSEVSTPLAADPARGPSPGKPIILYVSEVWNTRENCTFEIRLTLRLVYLNMLSNVRGYSTFSNCGGVVCRYEAPKLKVIRSIRVYRAIRIIRVIRVGCGGVVCTYEAPKLKCFRKRFDKYPSSLKKPR